VTEPLAEATGAAAHPHEVAADASMSIEDAAGVAVRLLPVAAALVGAHLALHGWDSLREGFAFVFRLRFLVPAFVGSVVLHEALHAAGFLLFGRARPSTLHFGIDRATLSPYAGCRAPLPARGYRAAVLLPGVALGVLPVAAGLAGGTAWLTLWGAFMLVTAGGDLAVLLALRGVPGRARVVDHPTRAGGLVLRD
jgi:hypothetical protein